jgi:multicomponent K+:H+ antiporter subunit E
MTGLRRVLPQPAVSLLILALWVALAPAAPGPGQVLLGAVVALALPLLTRRFWPDPPRIAAPGTGLLLGARVLSDIVVANVDVARRVLGPAAALRPAFVEVPLDLQDPFVATLLGSIVSLTPGTVSVDIDRARRVLRVHALHCEDTAAEAARIKARYEAPLRKVFGC